MNEAIEDLIESGERLRVYTAWLKRFIEGHVNTRIWHGDPDTFILETNTGESFYLSRTDPSLLIELAEPNDVSHHLSR
ncbi:MAG TPA: hypothetical protein VGJ87_14265 [Roseiflexaceae bacterium]|jgi:hypothetical protein